MLAERPQLEASRRLIEGVRMMTDRHLADRICIDQSRRAARGGGRAPNLYFSGTGFRLCPSSALPDTRH